MMTRKTLSADGLGLIIPINVEAMCVTKDTLAIFEPSPYDFSLLPNGKDSSTPFLSEKVMTSGLVKQNPGVHLHWALPDGLTSGESPQSSAGNVQFPGVPDRWLITRIYTSVSDPKNPVNQVKSWVIESNYISESPSDGVRSTITVPFKTDNDDAPQYRFMGRVQEYETWKAEYLRKKTTPDPADGANYVSGLSAVGYGIPEFSASYQNCKSLFGFHDTHDDLSAVANGEALLSYHVVGWYHDLLQDPMAQLPLQVDPVVFEALLNRLTDPNEKATLKKYYAVQQTDGPYVLQSDLTAAVQLQLIGILQNAQYDFLTAMLERCRWSLPSGTVESNPQVTHTLLTGVISPVQWDESREYFQPLDEQVNIAIGNTSSEALAALIASLSGNKDLPDVELLLNALQLGQLKGVASADNLNRIESLKLAIHESTYRSLDGGGLWQVSLVTDDDGDKGSGEVVLPETVADQLNQLNQMQVVYDKEGNDIDSIRTQIFMDWYRFMLVLHRGAHDPDHGMNPGNMADMITDEMDDLDERIVKHKPDAIHALAQKIRDQLPEDYALNPATAPRFWQPLEPVVLFQGNSINPPKRYGGDGRFMANGTLVCRLSSQVLTQLQIPAGALGNNNTLTFNAQNTPQLSSDVPLDYSTQVHALFTENCLLNASVIASLCLGAGSTENFETLSENIRAQRNMFITPVIQVTLPDATANLIQSVISEEDFTFFLSLYQPAGNTYQLQKPVNELSENDRKRLIYLFISSSLSWGNQIQYTGIAPSEIYFVHWDGNPWLPFSLSWSMTYYPLENISAENTLSKNYSPDFITANFKLGDITLEPKNPVKVPSVYQSYRNSIFMTPHAEENFQEQIRKFLEDQPDSPLDDELKLILESMKNFPPILSQSLNGLNDAMLMRNEVLQLQIKDPVPSHFYNFTNELVKDAVGPMTQSAPSPGNFYNPIRAGVMSISSLTIVDAFGRYIRIQTPSNVIIAENLRSPGLPANYMFLPPRVVQPVRLLFRWLAADNDALEMNTHPATTPICGWLLANHLDDSLWLYTNIGEPLGSLILSEDKNRVIWQSVPGGSAFGMPIEKFFTTGPGADVNVQFKQLAIALYNGGDGSYLKAFMRANDLTFGLIQPQNFKQLGSNAVLMGSPIAVAQAKLDLETHGLPAYNQSWEMMEKEVNEDKPRSDNGFTKIQFPVRLGAMEQVDDGLLGYFKRGDYSHYYTIHTDTPTEHVSIPDEKNILLEIDRASNSQLVTVLFDPRGSIHATSGVLPAKTISIPPDMFSDALQGLKMAFLITPILSSIAELGFPLPAIQGAKWTWLENELSRWSEAKEIAQVDDHATMSYMPQEIKEGWLALTKDKE